MINLGDKLKNEKECGEGGGNVLIKFFIFKGGHSRNIEGKKKIKGRHVEVKIIQN